MPTVGERAAVRRTPDEGLPTTLRTAFEDASGMSMEGVRVRRNSREPARIGADAFTRGDEIHLGPGSERHLAHEAWHVVQQRQGRVRARTTLGGQPLNAEPRLESEADQMAARAPQLICRAADGAPRIRRGAPAPDARGEPTPGSRIRRATRSRTVVQGHWNHVTPELLERFGNNPLRLLFAWSEQMSEQLGTDARLGAQVLAGLLDPDNDLFRLADARQRVLTFLLRTLANEEGGYDLDYLLAQIPVQAAVAERRADELEGPLGDHLEDEVQPPAPTEPVSLHNLHELAFDEIADNDPVLNVIATRIEFEYAIQRPDGDLKTWFEFLMVQWARHVATRDAILEGLGEDGGVVQAKFRAGTVSGPKGYTGLNGHAYTGVSYTRNAVGSIDFDAPTAQTSWVDPVDHGSVVELSTGSGSATKGLLQNGTLVKIAHANRNQHFDIANRIAGNGYGAASPPRDTWHHLVQEYEMVLVDFVVHQKHGHNGGVLYWT